MKTQKIKLMQKFSRGFTIVELMIVISISAVLAMYAQARIAREAEESLAQGSAVYLTAVANAATVNTLTNFNLYSTSSPVPGIAVPLRPTVAELVALGRLNTGFPSGANALPTRQSVMIDIQPNACPGAGCTLQVLACTTTPVTLGGSNVRYDLASIMTSAQKGTGGQSLQGFGGVIRGQLVNTPNPMGNIEGIVCSTSNVDTALYQRFVTIGDSRNPNLTGDLTVAGTTTLNGSTVLNGPSTVNNTLNVTGALTSNTLNVGPCINIAGGAQGNAGFGCANPADKPAGMQGVRSRDVIANGTIFTSDTPAAGPGSGNYATLRLNGGVAEVATSGRAVADKFVPTGLFAPGSACTPADESAIARSSSGTGLVYCSNLQWRPLVVMAGVGDACTIDGSQATAPSGTTMLCIGGTYRAFAFGTPNSACTNLGATAFDSTPGSNDTLICRKNPADLSSNFKYARLRDITTNMVFVTALEVKDGDIITKPTCQYVGGSAPIKLIQMIPKVVSSADGGIAIYAVDNGNDWTVKLRNGAGTVLLGTPNAVAVAQTFCYYY